MTEAPKDLTTVESTPLFSGPPVEIGYQIWARMCFPVVEAASSHSPQELAELYMGFLGAVLGSMSADFGHEQTVAIVRKIVESFADMKGELERHACQSHGKSFGCRS